MLLDRDRPEPLWQQIAESMRDHIRTRRWPEHYKLTAEEDLAEELQISRGTLRRALGTLVEEGLLVQIQGKGTFVTAKSTDLPLAQRLVSLHELLAESGQPSITEVVSREVIAGEERIRTLLAVPADEQVLWLRRRMVVDDEPFVLLDNYVRLALCPSLADVDFREEALFAAIEETGLKIGWGRRNFAATTAAAAGVTPLLTEAGDEPILYLEQVTYLDDERPIEYSDVWVRGDKMRVATVLHR
jgi:DNA-binding GntR family transcriptional regulator